MMHPQIVATSGGRDDEPRRLSLAALLLCYAEFDAPVIAAAISRRTAATAFHCPVFADRGTGPAITFRAQHDGINLSTTRAVREPANPNHPAANCFIRAAVYSNRALLHNGTSVTSNPTAFNKSGRESLEQAGRP
jgi:hypothetical protein